MCTFESVLVPQLLEVAAEKTILVGEYLTWALLLGRAEAKTGRESQRREDRLNRLTLLRAGKRAKTMNVGSSFTLTLTHHSDSFRSCGC